MHVLSPAHEFDFQSYNEQGQEQDWDTENSKMLSLTVQSKAVLPEKNFRQKLNLQILIFISHLNQIRNQGE